MSHIQYKTKNLKKTLATTLNIITIIFVCVILHISNLQANKPTSGAWLKINSITTKQNKYLTENEISFEGTFHDPHPTDVYTIVWDFGNGNIETANFTTATDMYANPGRCSPYKSQCHCIIKVSNTYSSSGTYNVTFSVETSNHTKYSDSEEIVVSDVVKKK